jgi:hypothetical protein
MLALYRGGRQAEALQAFQRLRGIVVDELGVEPSAALRDLHQRMLTDDPELAVPRRTPVPPVIVVPPICQLPADVPDFTGRREPLDVLTALLADRSPDAPPPVSVISGGPGVGRAAARARPGPDLPGRLPRGDREHAPVRRAVPPGRRQAR